MKYRTIRMLGGTVMIALATEAAPHLDLVEPCGVDSISFCPPYDRFIERTNPHTPENDYDTFGAENSGWIASGAVASTAANTLTTPVRYMAPRLVISGEEL